MLRARNAVESLQAEIITTQVGISSLKRSIIQIQVQREKTIITYRQEVEQCYRELINQLDRWKEEYVFISPIEGIL